MSSVVKGLGKKPEICLDKGKTSVNTCLQHEMGLWRRLYGWDAKQWHGIAQNDEQLARCTWSIG